jgi:ribosomal protein S18 acetylase RimI-like enzyme
MSIREAELGEEKHIARDYWLPLAHEMEAYSSLNEIKDEAVEEAIQEFQSKLGSEDQKVYIIESEGEEAGFMAVRIGEKAGRIKSKYLAITDLFVKKDFRDQGLGTELIEKAEELAEEEECDCMTVTAEEGNSGAGRLYRKLGFEEKKIKFTKNLK